MLDKISEIKIKLSLENILGNNKKTNLLLSFVGAIIVLFVSRNVGMFWDNVLFGSKMGTYLYENGLFNFNIPDLINPGHPPFLAFVQAVGWKIFGRTLFVSHLILFPFVFGFLYQLQILVSKYVSSHFYRLLAWVLVLCDPTVSAQIVLVGPEIILLFFFVLSVNSILSNRPYIKAVALAFLGLSSFRGMMICAGLFAFEFLNYVWINKNSLKSFLKLKTILPYVIGSIPSILFIIWRIHTKGWIQDPNSPWAECWQIVDFQGFIRNIIVLVQRYFDFGRIAIFVFLSVIFIRNKKQFQNRDVKQLSLLAIFSVILVIIVSLIYTNPFGHRYFVTSFIPIILLSFTVLQRLSKNKKIIYFLLFISLITGNLWIYPKRISQGWDSSLAHLPYFNLRREAIIYMDKNKIPIEKTATFFPNSNKIDDVDLTGDKRKFVAFDQQNDYVFYSNVYNLSDNNYDVLDKSYKPIKEFHSFLIKVVLMKRKDIE